MLTYPPGVEILAAMTFWGYLVDIFTLTGVVSISLLLLQNDLHVD